MTPRELPDKFLLYFTPERWSSTERFRNLIGSPFHQPPEVLRDVSRGVSASRDHLEKFDILVGLANDVAPRLVEDQQEFEEQGCSSQIRSRQFTVLSEALISELYSCLDGLRLALYGAYRHTRRLQKKSTERLFKRANQYEKPFPESVSKALVAAGGTWFPRLRKLRTELAHGGTGFCHLDPKTGTIRYSHVGLGDRQRAFVVDDMVKEVHELTQGVYRLTELVFEHLYHRLEPVYRRVLCGTYKGRIYEREVAPAPDLTFASGRCFSYRWFEQEAGLACPLNDRCGAYGAIKRDRPEPSKNEQKADRSRESSA